LPASSIRIGPAPFIACAALITIFWNAIWSCSGSASTTASSAQLDAEPGVRRVAPQHVNGSGQQRAHRHRPQLWRTGPRDTSRSWTMMLKPIEPGDDLADHRPVARIGR
jgi:hypothetical protein